MRVTVAATEIAIAGRVQAQVNTTTADGVQEAEMILRRIRLGANVQINELVSGRIHADFAGNAVALADAYMQLNFHRGLQLIAGRAHRPFGIMEQTTSLQIIPIERGVRIRGIRDFDLSAILSGLGYGEREIGLQLRGAIPGAPLGLSYAAGIFSGPVAGDAGDEQTQQLVGRLTVSPVPRSRVGVAWSRRDFVREQTEDAFEIESGDAFLVDFEYGGPTPAPGLHLVAQAARGDFEPFQDEDFQGAQLWAGYRVPAGSRITLVEPLIRISHASIDRVSATAADGGVLITPGVNIYMGGLNRLMLNYDIWQAGTGANARSAKAQFQLTF